MALVPGTQQPPAGCRGERSCSGRGRCSDARHERGSCRPSCGCGRGGGLGGKAGLHRDAQLLAGVIVLACDQHHRACQVLISLQSSLVNGHAEVAPVQHSPVLNVSFAFQTDDIGPHLAATVHRPMAWLLEKVLTRRTGQEGGVILDGDDCIIIAVSIAVPYTMIL